MSPSAAEDDAPPAAISENTRLELTEAGRTALQAVIAQAGRDHDATEGPGEVKR